MAPNQLKVGVGRYFQNHTYVPHEKSYQQYLDQMIHECLDDKVTKILDRHGKTLVYTYGQKDLRVNGNVLGIGDAISTMNPLALEGVRHAMVSGRLAARQIIGYFNGTYSTLNGYDKAITNYCGWRWRICELLANKIYRNPNDRHYDAILGSFKKLNFDELIELCFHYDWKKALRFYGRYLFLKIFSK